MISCYIIDDEPHAIEILTDLISQIPGLGLAGSATNPLVGLEAITSGLKPDLTFVDINMPELSGMELAAMIAPFTTVVFTTAYDQHAVEAFEKNALDYLLKPVTIERFLRCVNKYRTSRPLKSDESDHFFIKGEVRKKFIRVNLDEIMYVEASRNYVIIFLEDGQKLRAYLTLSEVEEHLPSERFSRLHLSFIVNDEKIKVIAGSEVFLRNNKALMMGGGPYRESFLAKVDKTVLRTKRQY